MWKPNIPEKEKKYLYFLGAALGLVLIFSWGQLELFTAGQLNTGRSYSSVNDSYTSSAFHSNNSGYQSAGTGFRQKKPGFWRGIQRSIDRYRALHEIERLQKLAEQTEDPEERAKIEAEIGDQYAYIIGDDEEAHTYYVRAITRGGNQVLSSRKPFSPEEKTPVRAPSFSFGAMGRSLGYYFSNANPYDIRTSRVMVLNDTSERARALDADSMLAGEQQGGPETNGQTSGRTTREELHAVVNHMISNIVHKDMRALQTYIPEDGIRCGDNVETSTLYTAKEAKKSLRNKKGPVYDALVGGIKNSSPRVDQVSYIIDDAPPIFSVGLSYPNTVPEDLQKRQQLYLQRGKKKWELIFIGK